MKPHNTVQIVITNNQEVIDNNSLESKYINTYTSSNIILLLEI